MLPAALAVLTSRLLVLASAYDAVAEDEDAQEEAAEKFRELTEVPFLSPGVSVVLVGFVL